MQIQIFGHFKTKTKLSETLNCFSSMYTNLNSCFGRTFNFTLLDFCTLPKFSFDMEQHFSKKDMRHDDEQNGVRIIF